MSQECYKYSPDQKIWGLVQGISWAGALWLLTSSIIDNIMQENCNGLSFASPDQSVQVSNITDLFVDDMNLYCNQPNLNQTLVSQPTHNVQMHSDLAYTSGGCIAFDKCKFFHLDFYFDSDGTSHLFTEDQ